MTNCVCSVYTSTAEANTEIEKVDDTKFLGMAVFVEDGKPKLMVVTKA